MKTSAPSAPLLGWSDRQCCDALAAERAGLAEKLVLHKPRSHRHAVLSVRLADVTARLLEVEIRLAATERHLELQWKENPDDQFPDRKSRAAGR